MDDYLNDFLVTLPSSKSCFVCFSLKRPISLFPPKATSEIFIQSRSLVFVSRDHLPQVRTKVTTCVLVTSLQTVLCVFNLTHIEGIYDSGR